MRPFLVPRLSFAVPSSLLALACAFAVHSNAADDPSTKNRPQGTGVAEPFRPEPGKFPRLEKAHCYEGELVFVDHATRRGSLRVRGTGQFYRNDPHPFALLPYGVVRYHGAPADLRDLPLGTFLHVRAFLPPDPQTSSVPVLPINNKDVDANHYRGLGVFPAENHALLLEDEPSHCQREGLIWKLQEVELKKEENLLLASRESKQPQSTQVTPEKLTFDSATRFWRGRECLSLQEWITEGHWPAEGKKTLNGQPVLLSLAWKPTPDGIFTRFHVSDIWLDETSIERAAANQTETHKAFIRSRWMPAWVDHVEYGKFGQATVTATLFGGMDPSLYADFTKGTQIFMNGAENTLKHTAGGYGPAHIASKGLLLQVTQASGEIPLGSSGIQIQFDTDLVIEAIRPTRIVRVRPASWRVVQLPREEIIGDGNSPQDRFPTPAIFPKY
ncbi:MAG: hypothetical protein RLZZ142_377 [Verrucomicrobiota bacterium]|jgi:hypothetical protein